MSRSTTLQAQAGRSQQLDLILSVVNTPPPIRKDSEAFFEKPPANLYTQGRRVALVIGNSSYAQRPLPNPVNDASDMAVALRALGFEVQEEKNLDFLGFQRAVANFEGSLRAADVGLIFFAGHGVEVNGESYLLPTNISFESEHEIKYQSMSLATMLGALRGGQARFSIVILDACRNNPFIISRGGNSGGLATLDEAKLYRDFLVESAPAAAQSTGTERAEGAKGFFIAYATAPGTIAKDGDGRNSPYTEKILQRIYTPNMEIEDMFKAIHGAFIDDSSSNQIPWKRDSVVGTFSFAPTR